MYLSTISMYKQLAVTLALLCNNRTKVDADGWAVSVYVIGACSSCVLENVHRVYVCIRNILANGICMYLHKYVFIRVVAFYWLCFTLFLFCFTIFVLLLFNIFIINVILFIVIVVLCIKPRSSHVPSS